MKTRTLKKNKVNVVTLGCSKNLFDSEIMMAQLKANKFEVQHESMDDDAEIVIINTCGFIDNAKQESIDTIIRYAEAKQDGMVDKLYVTGCLSERYKEELEAEIPEVDSFFGTRDLPRLLKTLKADYKHELIGERLLTTPSHFAYFKIAEGCDRPCSFCAIPLMRGKHVSTPIEELVKQAEGLARKGVKELMLIAQDLTYYGLDIYKKRALADLLRKLSDVEGIEWIRLHYAYPSGFPLDVLEVMKERDNICNYLDIPLQHGSTKVLKDMRRGITREKTEKLIENILQNDPSELLEMPKIGRKLPEVLSVEEIDQLIDAIDLSKPEGHRNKAILETLYSCGLRVSELVNLRFEDLFFTDGFLRITGKGNKQRLVPVSQTVEKEINIYVENIRTQLKIKTGNESYVFLNRRGAKLTRNMIFTIITIFQHR